MKRLFAIALIFVPSLAIAQEAPKSLDELLARVKEGYRHDADEMKKREAEFSAARDQQARLLAQAKAELAAIQKKSEGLEKEFQANERSLAENEETLRQRLGTMGELFGVVRQVAGDTRSVVSSSMISSQFPGRDKAVEKLAQSESLPSLEELQTLWYMLLQEMTESGKVVRYQAPVVAAKGDEKVREVVRVGTFNAVSEGKYLQWASDVQKLAELGRQPGETYLESAGDLEKASSGYVRMAVDPSRGAILALLVETPGAIERLDQGGFIGWFTLALGALAGLVAIIRGLGLGLHRFRVRRQLGNPAAPRTDNALGRVLAVHQANPGADVQELEAKLDEVIIREESKLERGFWFIKAVSVSATLLGLLGTITGMIRTFEAITLFGTGDPKLMAGGIAEALVTTMEGLMVAIPLVLMLAYLSTVSKGIMDVLVEQSAGVVALRAEKGARADVPAV